MKTMHLETAPSARGKRSIIAKIEDVVSIEATKKVLRVSVFGDNTSWFLRDNRANERYSLTNYRAKYDFVYISRSLSVNKDHINGMIANDGGVYVELSNGATHKVARRHQVAFKQFFRELEK